jgi:proton glutamate symport protein
MSDIKTADPENEMARPIQGSRAWLVLLALVLGLGLGALAARFGDGLRESALQLSELVGGLWLNALKMTVIPLVVALLVVGIARGAEAARGGRIAGRTVMWIVAVCTASAIIGMVLIQLLTSLFPLPQAAAQALQAGLAGLEQG